MSASGSLGNRMDAAVLVEPGRFEIERVPLPDPGPGQVRVRLQGCGVCASNLPPFEGRDWFQYPRPPGDLGHEGWGIIDACGEGVHSVEAGERVAALSFNAYAHYDVADVNAVVPLGTALEEQSFPGEAFGCVMNIWRRSDIRSGQTVAIVGAGFLGCALTRLAAHAGARVIAISRSESSLHQARFLGATETLPLYADGSTVEAVERLTEGRGCERVIEATGKAQPLAVAGQIIAFGGRLIIAGFHQDGPRTIDMQLWNWRGIDVINAHERDPAVAVEGMRQAVAAVNDGRLHPERLVTHHYPLASLTQALTDVKERPGGFIKGVVTMEET